MAVALTDVVAVHHRAIVTEVASVSVTTATLGSTPEVGVVAGSVVAVPVVAARRQRTEARGVVVRGRVAYGAGVCAA